jgi:hypothetical protein
LSSGKKFVWRNKMTDGYKICPSFKDIPLDLSNYLLIRTREHLLLTNKITSKEVFRPTLTSKLTGDYNQQAVNSIRRDLEDGLRVLNRLFYIDNEKANLPVAFATNTLYVLARNGLAQTPESQ